MDTVKLTAYKFTQIRKCIGQEKITLSEDIDKKMTSNSSQEVSHRKWVNAYGTQHFSLHKIKEMTKDQSIDY